MTRTGLLAIALLVAAASIIGGYLTIRGDAAAAVPESDVEPVAAAPLYRSSVVGTDFDFITTADPDAFQTLTFVGFKPFEMPDKRDTGEPLVRPAYVFNARFADGTSVAIALDAAFGSREAAEADARRYTPRLARLPSLYRQQLKHVVVHRGGADTTAFAEDKGHFFVIYSDNASRRIATHDLEETFFHEATHASIQSRFLQTAAWKEAKARDNAFVTTYAMTDDQEDFAESALFAYTLLHHPERLPPRDRAWIERQIPHRLAFFKTIFRS